MTNITRRPQVPCFEAYNGNAGDYAVSANTKITCFVSTSRNQGNHYNTSNQRWTCPTTGVWLFYAHFRMGAPGSVRVFRAEFTVNGSGTNDLCTCGGNNNYDNGGGYDHPAATGTLIRHLTAGDYVELYTSTELDSTNTLYIQTGQRSHWGCIFVG